MKKLALIILVIVIVSLPFVFTNRGSDFLEEKGYDAQISKVTEVYNPEDCTEDYCPTKVGEIIEFS